MSVNKGFILAAGFGTRMGDIGRILPKPLWPVFEKSMIELQIAYLKRFNITDIYANVHHQGSLLDKEVFEKKLPLKVLHEKEILDVGGGIINLSKNCSGGTFFIQNVDQFLFFDSSLFDKANSMMDIFDVVLFAIRVKKEQGYNKLLLKDDGLLKGIEKWNENISSSYYTYAGCSLVKVDKLTKKKTVKVNFFESVADYQNSEVGIVYVDDYEYWDFGTAQSYFESHLKLISDEKSELELRNFLISNKALYLKKIINSSYDATQKNVVNLTGEKIKIFGFPHVPQIHLSSQERWSERSAILYEGLSSQVSPDQMAQV